jgi:hypothetical protein
VKCSKREATLRGIFKQESCIYFFLQYFWYFWLSSSHTLLPSILLLVSRNMGVLLVLRVRVIAYVLPGGYDLQCSLGTEETLCIVSFTL